VDDDFEQWKATAVAMSTHPGECVLCYVHRMVTAFGCDGTLRWALRWRDRRAPRAVRLEARLTARGAHCDCELFSNGWQPAGTPGERGPRAPESCAGTIRASAPCDNWGAFGRASW
jgi:hypothetical protein